MKKIELELDERTLWKAKAMANQKDINLSKLISYAIEKLAAVEPPKDRILGAWAEEPELVDTILEDIMKDRGTPSLNQNLEPITH